MDFPYGGFDAAAPDPERDPWSSLHEIQRQLERGEPISPSLARWLGEAIEHSGDDTGELLRRLGLRKGKGKPSPYPRDAWAWWGQRVEQERAKGLSPEKAIDSVLDQMNASGLWDQLPDRATLQRWAKTWAKAWDAQCEEWGDMEANLPARGPEPDDPFAARRHRMRELLRAWRAEAAELRREEETAKLPQPLREQLEAFDRHIADMLENIRRA